MHDELAIPYFREFILVLVVAAVVVPTFARLRVSPTIGFLAAGLIVGPSGLGGWTGAPSWVDWLTIRDVEGTRGLAQLGVVFLLFVIGLELSFERLWALRRLVFGLGTLQVAVTGGALTAVALSFGNATPAAVIIGASLALSSTAIGLQVLSDQRRLGTAVGRTAFSVLLLQDLAVLPLLFLVDALGRRAGESAGAMFGWALAEAALTVALIWLVGRILLRRFLHLVGASRRPDSFMAATLLVVFGASGAAAAAGLSMALGAFVAGLLLAETEFRHEVEVNVRPFQGLLLGLFFMTVGMGIDLPAALAAADWLLPSVVGLVAIKAAILALLCLIFGTSRAVAVDTALLLGQAGEFAFVLVGLGLSVGLIEPRAAQFMFVVTGLSMFATPPLAALGRRWGERLARGRAASSSGPADSAGGMEGHVVVAGFGRIGGLLGAIMEAQRIPYLALDRDPARVKRLRRGGTPVYFGDASNLSILRSVGIEKARALVVTMDSFDSAEAVVRAVKRVRPDLPILARARDSGHARKLRESGATEVVPEALEAGLYLGELLLRHTGMDKDAARETVERHRARE